MIKFSTFVFLLCSLSAYGQIIYQNDFESEESQEEMAVFDLDGLVPAPGVSYITDGWNFLYFVGNPSTAAASTSWYDPTACCSDDWLITPGIELPEGAFDLSFESWASDEFFLDGFEVWAGTGPSPDEMTTLLLSVPEAEHEWITRTLSLSEFAGQTIFLAWRNISNNKNVLCIDNILVRSVYEVDLKLLEADIESLMTEAGDLTTPLSITVKNVGSEVITSFDVSYQWNLNEDELMSLTDLDLQPGESYSFDHSSLLTSAEAFNQFVFVFLSNINGQEEDDNALDNSDVFGFHIAPTVPDWTLIDSYDNEVRLHDELQAGKTILFHFIISNNEFSQAAGAELSDFYESHGGVNSEELVVYNIAPREEDSASVLNDLEWLSNSTIIPYTEFNLFLYSYYNSHLDLVPVEVQGLIPFFVMFCPNIDEPQFSSVVKAVVGFDLGDIDPGFEADYQECRQLVDPQCPDDLVITSFPGNNLLASGSYDSFQWFFNGDLIEGATVEGFTAYETGNYSCVATDVQGCESLSEELFLLICPEQVVVSGSIELLTATEGYDSYQWFLNGLPLTEANGSDLMVELDGNYTVVADTEDELCTSTSDEFAVQGTGLRNVTPELLHIFPNPVEDLLFIESNEVAKMTLIDPSGRSIEWPRAIEVGMNSLDFSSLNAGLYLLRFDTPQGSFYKRVILQ